MLVAAANMLAKNRMKGAVSWRGAVLRRNVISREEQAWRQE